MCLWFCLASLWVYWLLPLGTLSLGRCFTKKSTSPNPYVAYEGVKRTTHKQPNWPMGTMCVCLSAFPGARSVCAGSEEAKALIKEQAWYRDASLTAWGHATWWGPDESHQTGLLPPNQQRVGAPITFHSSSSRLSVYSGIWGVSHQIKVTFSFDGTLMLFLGHRTMCYLMFQRVANICSAHTEGLFFFLLVIKCKYLICSWPLCLGGGGGVW